MRDILLPATDAGVAVQVLVAAVGFAVLYWLVRRHRDLRFLVAALAFATFAFFGLRAAH